MNSTDPDDAYSDLGGGTAPPPPLPRDRYGQIDKSAPDDPDYPADWTPEQRVAAYWQKIDVYRDRQEYEQATGHFGSLASSPPASEATRAAALNAFANRQLAIDEDDPDAAVPYVNPLLVACPFCGSTAGKPCIKPGRPGQREKLTDIAGHPGRIEAAALAKGFSREQADALVAAACSRQTKRIRGQWQPSDLPQVPMTPPDKPSAPAPPVDTSPQRGAQVAASGEHEPKKPEPEPEQIPGGGWRDEKGALHFPDTDALDRAWAKRHDETIGR